MKNYIKLSLTLATVSALLAIMFIPVRRLAQGQTGEDPPAAPTGSAEVVFTGFTGPTLFAPANNITATAQLSFFDNTQNSYIAWYIEVLEHNRLEDGSHPYVWGQSYPAFFVPMGQTVNPTFSQNFQLPPGKYYLMVGIKDSTGRVIANALTILEAQ